jgi:hypothetical protein
MVSSSADSGYKTAILKRMQNNPVKIQDGTATLFAA